MYHACMNFLLIYFMVVGCDFYFLHAVVLEIE